MAGLNVYNLVNNTIEFNYKDESELRRVSIVEVKNSKTGNLIITGTDDLRNGKFRSFNVHHIKNVVIIPEGWSHV